MEKACIRNSQKPWRNDFSELPLCNQFHQVNAETVPDFITKILTWDRHDEMRIIQVDGILRRYNHLDIVSVQK